MKKIKLLKHRSFCIIANQMMHLINYLMYHENTKTAFPYDYQFKVVSNAKLTLLIINPPQGKKC